MAEAFVKTFKRYSVRVSAIPTAAAAWKQSEAWIEDHNTAHPHSGRGYRSPRKHISAQSAASPA
jgi:transposase InsO family protein